MLKIICVVLLTVGGALGQGGKFTTFSVPGSVEIGVNSINSAGTVVGYYEDQVGDVPVVHAYLRLGNGTIETFDYPGAVNDTEATAVNQSGAVAGYYANPNGVYHGFIMATNGSVTSFDAPGAGFGNGFSSGTLPLGMNAAGTICGYYIDGNYVKHGFVRLADGTFQTFDVPGAGGQTFAGTQAFAIGESGAVTGFYSGGSTWGAFLRSRNGEITVFTLPESGEITAAGINAYGTIAGYYSEPTTSVPTHGFLRAVDGTITTFDGPGAGAGQSGTIATAINDQGYVAGWFYDSNDKIHGFVRSPGGKISALNVPGFVGTYPTAINDLGQVAGVDFYSANAFVLTPGQ